MAFSRSEKEELKQGRNERKGELLQMEKRTARRPDLRRRIGLGEGGKRSNGAGIGTAPVAMACPPLPFSIPVWLDWN